ncbi:MAG TPA: TraM recognition domain-containing protein [Polyangiaceae bacterium]|nr:TraM recognition domain-containing protein [Polyangiaceae bacterium]
MQPDPLDAPLCLFSPQDAFTLRDACEGVCVVGGTGSGKTSGSGQTLAHAFLQAGFGGLVLTVKPDDRALWEGYCRACGREDDLIIVAPDQPHRFNFLNFEFSRPGAGAGITENIAHLFMTALEVGGRSAKESGSDPFWNDSRTLVLRHMIVAAASGLGRVSLAELHDIIVSAPQSPEQVLDPCWQRESLCFACLEAAERNARTPDERQDYEYLERFWLGSFPQLAEKTRSIIVTSFVALADSFLRQPLRQLFCTDTTIAPEATERGKIILLDLPVKEYNEVGVFAQVLFKLCWQKAIERRDTRQSPRPVFLISDEAQYFLTSYDQLFQTTARSSRVCTVYLTQNLPNFYAAFGEGRGRSQADSLLGNLQTKVLHCNGDAVTNEWASKMIAQTWQSRTTVTGGSSLGRQGETENSGFSAAEQLAAQVLPVEFTTLAKGGPQSGFVVEGIVFQSGRVWNASRSNHLRVLFPQRPEGK